MFVKVMHFSEQGTDCESEWKVKERGTERRERDWQREEE